MRNKGYLTYSPVYSIEDIPHHNSNTIILIIHGGCFVGGDAHYDEKLATTLCSKGYEVIRLSFSTENLDNSTRDITHVMDILDKRVERKVVMGISSGAFLALVALNEFYLKRHYSFIDTFIGLCPVLDPYKRFLHVLDIDDNNNIRDVGVPSHILAKQLQYFESIENMEKLSMKSYDNHPLHILFISMKCDNQAPPSLVLDFMSRSKSIFDYELYEGYDHSICGNPTDDIIERIFSYISNRKFFG